MTGSPCSICTHAEVRSINAALLQGESDASVSRRWKLSPDATRRHRVKRHFPPTPEETARAARLAAEADSEGLLEVATKLRNKAISLLVKAENTGDFRTALAGVREATRCLQLMGELEGDLRGPTVNIAVGTPDESLGVAIAILGALRDEPVARAKVLAALAKFSLVPPTVEHEAG